MYLSKVFITRSFLNPPWIVMFCSYSCPAIYFALCPDTYTHVVEKIAHAANTIATYIKEWIGLLINSIILLGADK